jgi:asparagine synthase (glutamine-hydrolysing)
MCGICGKLYYDGEQDVAPDILQRMMDVISHRGPDGEGKYVAGPVGLGHRRLAIIDLTSGAQPMCNEDKTVWIVFNGEIYNFQDLRQELLQKGHRFASNSDTETIIHAYEEYGVECLSKLQGMFAFALWDEKNKTLLLARDRVGIKPLYYHDTGRAILFGSEIKSLLLDPDVNQEIDPASIDRFLSYLYLPGKRTLYKSIHKLEPGHCLVVKDGRVVNKEYWDLRFVEGRSWNNLEEAAEHLWQLLKRTVRGYMISDVPVGFLLSGGVDSTALLSCALSETDKRISTFTIGFAENDFADERVYARLAAEKFGTDHHEITISVDQFSDFLPKYVWHMEEPVCEPPAVALYYVSKLASEHVKVVLSGEGGDEAFGGYQNYRNLLLLEKGKKAIPPLNGVMAGVLKTFGKMQGFHRARKYAPLLNKSLSDYYLSRVSTPFSYFNRNKNILYTSDFRQAVDTNHRNGLIDDLFLRVKEQDVLNQMLYVDTKTWLPDDLLVKADKITMANSLELRVPLLDHVVLEFAASLPPEYKVRGLHTKRILKKAFEKHVPEQILKRKKTGFPVPYARWLRGPLRDYVRGTLLDGMIVKCGYFERGGIEKLLSRSDAGEQLSKEIFSLLTLELWHEQFAASAVA